MKKQGKVANYISTNDINERSSPVTGSMEIIRWSENFKSIYSDKFSFQNEDGAENANRNKENFVKMLVPCESMISSSPKVS